MEKKRMTCACVHLSADIDVQRRGVGWRAYRLLGEVRWRAPRLRTVLRGRLVSHAGSTHVPVIGNLLASRSGGRANPGAISAYIYIYYMYTYSWSSMSECREQNTHGRNGCRKICNKFARDTPSDTFSRSDNSS